jgi:hypothetical protein
VYAGLPFNPVSKVGSAVYLVAAVEQPPPWIGGCPKDAITNCHVVANAKFIVLANAARTLGRKLCDLSVMGGEPEAVPGFQAYASVAVGEAVFRIHAPSSALLSEMASRYRHTEE